MIEIIKHSRQDVNVPINYHLTRWLEAATLYIGDNKCFSASLSRCLSTQRKLRIEWYFDYENLFVQIRHRIPW